ncbi:MAG: hypothetical protein ABFC18_06475 [Rikenellaceae bacterium]
MQIKIVLYVKEHVKITNAEYQKINSVSKTTATRDLAELTDTYKILEIQDLVQKVSMD